MTRLRALNPEAQHDLDAAVCAIIAVQIPKIFKHGEAFIETHSPFWPYPMVWWDLHMKTDLNGPSGNVSISRQDMTTCIEWAATFCDADGEVYTHPIPDPLSPACLKEAISTVLYQGMFVF